jgi:hypothetical protein
MFLLLYLWRKDTEEVMIIYYHTVAIVDNNDSVR